jgi:transposase
LAIASAGWKRNTPLKTPEILGIDDVHLNPVRCGWCSPTFTQGHKGENTIVDLVGSRKKKVVIHALHRFKKLNQIKFVTMDMWRPYYDAVKAVLPEAVIVTCTPWVSTSSMW